MLTVLAVFSVMIMAVSLYGVALPRELTGLVRRFMAGPGVPGAVAIRLVLAALLWFSAAASRTPGVFRVLALLALLSATVLPFMGATRLLRLIDRVAAWPPMAIRLPCLLGVAFGAFLLWSSWPGLAGA